MLGEDDEAGGQDHQDRLRRERRCVELGRLEPGGLRDGREVDDPGGERRAVARDDADENGDDAEKAPEEHGPEDRDAERHHRHGDGRSAARLGRPVAGEPGHARGHRGELEADDRDDGPHRGGREDDVEPPRARHADDLRNQDEEEAERDEAALGRGIAAQLRVREHREDRREEGEARPEVGRDLPAADHEVDERADAVHQERRRRAHLEEEGHEHRRAEHREEVLEGERERLKEREPLVDVDDPSLHGASSSGSVGQSIIENQDLTPCRGRRSPRNPPF